MEKLTRAEEDVMLIIWDLQEAFVKEIIEQMPHPRPHYNTVATMVKLLQEKGFVDYKSFGKSYQFYPLIKKDTYFKRSLMPMLKNYFDGSARQLISFFVKEKGISIKELEKLIEELKRQ